MCSSETSHFHYESSTFPMHLMFLVHILPEGTVWGVFCIPFDEKNLPEEGTVWGRLRHSWWEILCTTLGVKDLRYIAMTFGNGVVLVWEWCPQYDCPGLLVPNSVILLWHYTCTAVLCMPVLYYCTMHWSWAGQTCRRHRQPIYTRPGIMSSGYKAWLIRGSVMGLLRASEVQWNIMNGCPQSTLPIWYFDDYAIVDPGLDRHSWNDATGVRL